jgi:single-strand DNA-binding protein
MLNMNRWQGLGNLTKDPELKYSPAGKALVRLSLATNHSYKNEAGEWVQIPQFTNVTFWGNPAEFIARNIQKGERMYVEGRLETRSYEDKDGVKKYATEVNGKDFILLNDRRDKGEDKLVEEAKQEFSGGY